MVDLVKGCSPDMDTETGRQEHRNRQLSTLVVNIETDVQS